MRGIAFSRLLMFVVLVPLAGLAIFGGKLSYDSWSRYNDLSRATSVLRLALATAKFVGVAIPGEGAMSRETIAGKNDPAGLEARRKTTDDLYRGVVEAGAGGPSPIRARVTVVTRWRPDRVAVSIAKPSRRPRPARAVVGGFAFSSRRWRDSGPSAAASSTRARGAANAPRRTG